MSFSIHNLLKTNPKKIENFNYVWPTFDGYSNNMKKPYFGKSNQPLLRTSPLGYQNGINSISQRGLSNPSPRKISNSICQGVSTNNLLSLSNMMWVWGQFLDHEVDLTPEGTEHKNMTTDPSDVNELYHTPVRTINFKSSIYKTVDGVKQQINTISSVIDATNVYGSESSRCIALRLMDGSGKMKTSLSDNKEVILPYNLDNLDNAMSTSSSFFIAGDVRSNENVLLTAMHTLFVREHNHLCDEFVSKNPSKEGNDEYIFQYARKMIIGFQQNITFNEFLPYLLGDFAPNDKDSKYNDIINSGITNEFSTVGYRVGHSMLSSTIKIGSSNQNIQLKDAFFNPAYVQQNGIDDLLLGATLDLMQKIDGIIVEDVRSFLFGPPTSTTLLDLASLNIQRGRDHGIPDYNTLRQSYGLSTFTSFNQIPTSASNIIKLEELYDTVNDIDPWIGAIIEDHLPGKPVGPLIYKILSEQFIRSRKGDRYWFENSIIYNEIDKSKIRNTTLSDILTRNTKYKFKNDVFKV